MAEYQRIKFIILDKRTEQKCNCEEPVLWYAFDYETGQYMHCTRCHRDSEEYIINRAMGLVIGYAQESKDRGFVMHYPGCWIEHK